MSRLNLLTAKLTCLIAFLATKNCSWVGTRRMTSSSFLPVPFFSSFLAILVELFFGALPYPSGGLSFGDYFSSDR